MADETPDPVASVLQRAPASQAVRASAWDAYQASSSPDDLTAKIQGLALPKEIKAQLWDLKHAASQQLVAPMNTATVNGQAVPVDQGGDVLLDSPIVQGVIGAGKALLRSGVRGGEILRMIPGVDALANKLPSASVPVEPTNTAQKVGGMLEQGAEVLAPSMAVSNAAAKTAEVVAPALTRILGKTAAKVLPTAAVEAGGNVGLAKLQGASNPEAAVSGAVGAAVPVAGATIGHYAVQIADALKRGAGEDIARFFNPTRDWAKRVVQKETPAILERGSEVLGPLGRNREAAVEAFAGNREAAGQAVDAALSQFGSDTVKDAPQRLMAALDASKAPYVKRRLVSREEATGPLQRFIVGEPMADGRAMAEIPLNATKINQIDGLKAIVAAHGTDMTIDDLVGLRRAWDEIAYMKPGTTLETVKTNAAKWARKMGGDAIRSLVASDKPELTAVNREFSFWKNLEDVMTATVQRKTGQSGALIPTIAQGAGTMAGAATGNIGAAIAAGKAAKTLQQVFASPRYASLSAQVKTVLADAIASGNAGRIQGAALSALLRLGAVEGPMGMAGREPLPAP